MSDQIRVNRGNLTELKNAVDDHLKKYLTTTQGYTENHRHIDIKLSLGYISCAFASFASWYGYVNSFEESRTLTAVCVVVYFVLNGILLLYTTFVEKNTVFVGFKRDAVSKSPIEILTISANLKRFSHIYELTFTSDRPIASKSSANAPQSRYLLECSFGAWFDENGLLFESELERDIRDALEKSGAKTHVQ